MLFSIVVVPICHAIDNVCGSYHEKGEDFRFEAVTWLGAQGTTTPSDPRRRRESQLRAHRSPPQAPPTAPLRCFRAIH